MDKKKFANKEKHPIHSSFHVAFLVDKDKYPIVTKNIKEYLNDKLEIQLLNANFMVSFESVAGTTSVTLILSLVATLCSSTDFRYCNRHCRCNPYSMSRLMTLLSSSYDHLCQHNG